MQQMAPVQLNPILDRLGRAVAIGAELINEFNQHHTADWSQIITLAQELQATFDSLPPDDGWRRNSLLSALSAAKAKDYSIARWQMLQLIRQMNQTRKAWSEKKPQLGKDGRDPRRPRKSTWVEL